MRKIPVYKRGRVVAYATVSNRDFAAASGFRWYLAGGYVCQWSDKTQPRRLHRFIVRPPRRIHVDHRDHNKLNNARSNLRILSHASNVRHQKGPAKTNKSSGILGVHWNEHVGYWYGVVQVNGVRIQHHFSDKQAAARFAAAIRSASITGGLPAARRAYKAMRFTPTKGNEAASRRSSRPG